MLKKNFSHEVAKGNIVGRADALRLPLAAAKTGCVGTSRFRSSNRDSPDFSSSTLVFVK